MAVEPLDHSVSRYALSVVEGETVAGDLVRMACERHLLDLETAGDRGWRFDPERASQVIKFASLLTHQKGPDAGKPIKLQPWQKFRHGSVYGWVNEETGLRRFRSTYHQVGKKNGKTTDTASPMLYSVCMDGEGSAEAYCAATTRDQAKILFNGIGENVKKSPLLRRMFGATRQEIVAKIGGGGVIKALSRDSGAIDGANPSFLARDEMHRWTDRELAETLTESMIARAQPIDWVITTAGHDIGGLCGETRQYAEQVLRGAVADDRFFAYVAEPPPDADPLDPRAWLMGNPNLGISKPVEAVKEAAERAVAIAGQMPNFRRFHLNLWTETADTWIGRDVWDYGEAVAPLDITQFRGLKAWVGLDLSETTDTTALAVAVPVGSLIYLFAYTFIPSGKGGHSAFIKRAQREKKEYVGWAKEGWLEVHHGAAINTGEIIARMKWVREFFDLQEVAFDAWGSAEVRKALDDMRFPLLEHRQGFQSMSQPMRKVEEAVAENRIRHGGNPVLGWQVGNVAPVYDDAMNVKPSKKRSQGRIDAAVASIMAVGRATRGETAKKIQRGAGAV
ncbi:MAG: terminase [Alteromonadaceae bacterium]|nr:terminase [Alteromonadaceae bacterium]